MARKQIGRPRKFASESAADDVLRHYMNDVGRYPVLTREQEREITRAVQAGDAEALELLVKSNLRFVISYAKRYQHHGVPLHDLIQEGNIGLLIAARTFDPDRGFRFLTHARHWVRAQMTRAIEKSGRTVRLPASQLRKLSAIRHAAAELERELRRQPTDEELAERVGMSLTNLNRVRRLDQPVVSMDAPTGSDSEGRDLHALVASSDPDPTSTVELERRKELVRQAVASIEARRQRVIELYFGLSDEQPLTLEQIGDMLGVTRERIRQLRNDAIGKVRRRLEQAGV